jgi:two-component system, cell cycle response regulator
MAQHALDGNAMNLQEKPVIMIADDSRVVRVSLKNILKNDCRLIEAEDGQQAWEELLESPSIRLIFSDLSMPKLNGRELLQKIRNSEITRIRNIPFIVVTGNEKESGTREELQDLGATEVISKPFDPASIVNFVSTLVSRQESESYMLLPEEENQSASLPGVLNQQEFMINASKELSFAIRNKNELAIALLRIDQYDQLESHYSDPAIEHILLTTAEVIRQHIHPDDSMAYFGDGLFAILRPASNAIGTRYIGRRILDDLISKQFYLGESEDVVSLSIGISAPQIKPGIRLRELLLLAEGRLKAAMDLGGNRVIDKGNDTLTSVGLATDPLLGQSSDTEPSSNLHSDSIRSSHLRLDSEPSRLSMLSSVRSEELAHKVEQLQSRLESLTHENKDLQNQIARWRAQSGESEQLRHRVFELESEQQHMQLKLNELSNNNSALQKRALDAETLQQQLIESEDEKTATLKQANQFYEQENIRLEGQLEALNTRAQKAELAQRKSEQLVISLKDNIKLLRAQMEQIQHQLVEAQEQAVALAADAPSRTNQRQPVDEETNLIVDEETYLEARADSELQIDGFPSSRMEMPERIPTAVEQLFADPTKPVEKPSVQESPPKPSAAPTYRPVEHPTDRPDPSIPVYRPEPPPKFKEPRTLSSFAIASLILLALVALGGGYLYYFYWEKDVDPAVAETQSATAVAADKSPVADAPSIAEPAKVPSQPAQPLPARVTPKPQTVAPVPSPSGNAPSSSLTDEEARLQAELTLRQLAEEEFRQQLQQVDQEAVVSQPATPVSASAMPVESEPAAAPAETSEPAAEIPSVDLISGPAPVDQTEVRPPTPIFEQPAENPVEPAASLAE